MKNLLLIFMIITGLCFVHSSAALDIEEDYIIISSGEMDRTVRELEIGIERITGKTNAKRLDYAFSEARSWLERLGIDFIPYVIFDKKIEMSDKFFELVRNGMIERKEGEYVIPEAMLKIGGMMFFKKERMPHRLDLFVMSHCPAGKDALRQMGDYIEKNPGSFNVVCHYITIFHEFGITSLHGPEEIKENIHQILIQKYYADKFWAYLKMFREGMSFEDACGKLGIPLSEITKRKEEGIALLEKDFNLCEELEVNSSPTFLWENQSLFISIDSFRQAGLLEQ